MAKTVELEPRALLWVYEPGSGLSTHPSFLCCPSWSHFMTPRSGHLGLQLARGFFWGRCGRPFGVHGILCLWAPNSEVSCEARVCVSHMWMAPPASPGLLGRAGSAIMSTWACRAGPRIGGEQDALCLSPGALCTFPCSPRVAPASPRELGSPTCLTRPGCEVKGLSAWSSAWLLVSLVDPETTLGSCPHGASKQAAQA